MVFYCGLPIYDIWPVDSWFYKLCGVPSQMQKSFSPEDRRVGTKNSSFVHTLLPSYHCNNKRDRVWTPALSDDNGIWAIFIWRGYLCSFGGFLSVNVRWACGFLPRGFNKPAYQNLWYHKCLWLNLHNILGWCSRLWAKTNSGMGRMPIFETASRKWNSYDVLVQL